MGPQFARLAVDGLIDASDRVLIVPELAQGALQFALLRGLLGGLVPEGRGALRIDDVDDDVIGHEFALHDDPGLGAHDVEHAHEGPFGAFEDVNDGAVGVLVPDAGAGEGDPDAVAVQGAAGLGRGNEDVVFEFFYLDKEVAVARHLRKAFIFGMLVLLVFFDFVRDSAAIASFTARHRVYS